MTAQSQNAPFFVDTENITLSANGLWLSDGIEIDHEQTRRLFARSLRRDQDGWFLQVGRETKRIVVEDTAYFIHRIDGDPAQGVRIWLNDETQEPLDPTTLAYRPGRLTCRVHGGKDEAKFLHSAYFDLLQHLHEDARIYYLDFGGRKIVLANR